jgi:thiamine pyrophosphate-dependent acetolactate synthase large subunit-like protein
MIIIIGNTSYIASNSKELNALCEKYQLDITENQQKLINIQLEHFKALEAIEYPQITDTKKNHINKVYKAKYNKCLFSL